MINYGILTLTMINYGILTLRDITSAAALFLDKTRSLEAARIIHVSDLYLSSGHYETLQVIMSSGRVR